MNRDTVIPDVRAILACPRCQGDLRSSDSAMDCAICGARFPQASEKWLEFLPPEFREDDHAWQRRQLQMEDWYNEFIDSPKDAGTCLTNDYAPYADAIGALTGRILDIGGGCGIPRHFLADDTEYIVIDPSLDWIQTDWRSLADVFPCLEIQPAFVHGVGERLPFTTGSFDAVLAFWSLNHASQPSLVLQQALRVLKSGGRLLLVLEDMIPSVRDLLDPEFPAPDFYKNVFDPERTAPTRHPRLALLWRRLQQRRWPLQSDHVRIRETEIYQITHDRCRIDRRYWAMHFLSLEFTRLPVGA